MKSIARLHNEVVVECFDRYGRLKWRRRSPNMYVQEGRDYILNTIFKNGTRYDPLYVLLHNGTPADDWTMANNGSTWTEITDYDESTRPEFVDGSISGTTTRQLDNSASKATFTMNAGGTVSGAGLCTTSVKGSTTGILLCAAGFTEGSVSYVATDVINVTYIVGFKDDSA